MTSYCFKLKILSFVYNLIGVMYRIAVLYENFLVIDVAKNICYIKIYISEERELFSEDVT